MNAFKFDPVFEKIFLTKGVIHLLPEKVKYALLPAEISNPKYLEISNSENEDSEKEKNPHLEEEEEKTSLVSANSSSILPENISTSMQQSKESSQGNLKLLSTTTSTNKEINLDDLTKITRKSGGEELSINQESKNIDLSSSAELG